MADRKTAVAEPIDLGLSANDMGVPVLSIVHTSSAAFKNGVAKFGDIIISEGDDESDIHVAYAQGSDPLRCYVVGPVSKWLAPKFGQGEPGDRWDVDDTTAPPTAQLVMRYTLLVPSYSTIMPVHYYARSSAIGSFKPLVNKIALSALDGIAPYNLAFDLTTSKRSGSLGDWYVPVPRLAEAKPEEIEVGKGLFEQIAAPRQSQIEAGDPSY